MVLNLFLSLLPLSVRNLAHIWRSDQTLFANKRAISEKEVFAQKRIRFLRVISKKKQNVFAQQRLRFWLNSADRKLRISSCFSKFTPSTS